FGILAALVVEMSFIPAIRMLMSPPSERQTEREQKKEFFDPILEKLAEIVLAGKEKPILYISLGLIAMAGVGATQLDVGNSLGEQFFEANAPVRGFRLADSRLAGTRVIQVLVEGKHEDAIKDPKVLASMDQLAKFIQKQRIPIGKVVSIVDVLKQMNRAIDNDPKSEKIPDTLEGAAQLLLLYSMSGDSEDLTRLVDYKFQNAVITAYVKTDDFRMMQEMTAATQAEADRLFAGTA